MNGKLIYRICISVLAMLCALSCTKEDLPEYKFVGDGASAVSLGITFRPLAGAALGGATRSVNGDVIGEIDDVFVAWYRADDRTLVGCRYFSSAELTITDVNRPTQPDGTTVIPADGERTTKHAEFKGKVEIPYGRYRIYAVANMGDMTDDVRIKNEADFRAVSLEWRDDIAKNCQMSGYFKVDGENPADSVAVIDRPNIALHSWIRRAVSKVTIAFDATKLNENIYIYLKSAQIKDIPSSCPLVDTNCPSSASELIEKGDTIVYGRGDDYEKWLRLACGRGVNKYGSHSDDDPSLFFFENMQGKHANKHEYKNFDSKDGMPYGTYVEVTGYYVNKSFDNPSYGNIVYRCMLGRNMTDDFNAERNAHYRLTLVFNKDANDVDWHIDYDYVPKPPEIVVPNPMYISYLSNRFTDIPISVYYDPEVAKIVSLKVDIEENDWGYEDHKYYGKETNPNNNNGFLSLERSTATSVDGKKVYCGSKTFTTPVFKCDTVWRFNVPVYTRPINLGSGYSGNNYYVGRRRHAKLLLTAKIENLVAKDPVTGKNATFEITETLDVIQIRRLVNPKGIWRANGSDKSFRITLKNSNSSPTVAYVFEDVYSDGPWSAKILKGADWIRIKDAEAGDSTYGIDSVSGGTGSKVDFYFKPKDGNPAGGCRFGLIEVRIHNYTCPHVILVSQGIGPVNIGGKKWHMTNVRYCGVDEENPLLEGSMFKFGTSGTAFRSINNTKSGYGFREDTYSPSEKMFDTYDASGANVKKTFMEVAADLSGFTSASMNKADFTGKTSHVATYEDWQGITDLTTFTRYYGVLYGDECTETLNTNTVTNTYTEVGDVKGMRGCFVCDNNSADGAHLFFPIGNTGYGRRLYRDDNNLRGGAKAVNGALKYADRSSEMEDPTDVPRNRPCLYDLWQENGAIYWYGQKAPNGNHGFDINYYTFGFQSYTTSNVWAAGTSPAPTQSTAQSDICFVRRVYD